MGICPQWVESAVGTGCLPDGCPQKNSARIESVRSIFACIKTPPQWGGVCVEISLRTRKCGDALQEALSWDSLMML